MDCGAKRLVDFGQQFGLRAPIGVEFDDVPVLTSLDPAGRDPQPMPGQQLVDVAVNRGGPQKICQPQIPFQGRDGYVAPPTRRLSQSPKLPGISVDVTTDVRIKAPPV